MRLLQRNNDGRYTLTEFIGDAIPRYAILSHTWGADHDEVNLADLEKDTNMIKGGFKKIHFCADQAAKDNLRYFWVDTCCIDKTSSAELTEAINSMVKWYRKATQCYVYLPDVSTGSLTSASLVRQDWYPAFQQSRWFTRGWTLQELLAPTSVEFFSAEGERLGSKCKLVQELHSITGISAEALRGIPLYQFSVDERMSWMARRQTKREEDMAYSLLGIFNVHMPLIYGEGRANALARLHKEISARSGKEQSTLSHNVVSQIPGPHTTAGGTTNFNFGYPPTQHQPSRRREPFSTVPFAPDPDFVDRPEIVTWVRDKCAGPGARAALVGLGGVGKSQLAIHYAHSIRDESPETFVFWLHASTRARFEEAYRDIANRLQLPGRSDPKADVLRLVSDWLRDEANGRWVMVVDNVDNVETFFPSRKRQRDEADTSAQIPLATYLPQSRNGAVLFTSRSKDVAARLAGGYNKIKEVLAMNENEGLQLLYHKLCDPTNKESAAELLRALDWIPLAISQAGAYINRRARMTVARYLDDFWKSSKKRESLLNSDAGELRRDESASNAVVTTWQMSFEQIRRERPSAAELLSLMSFFNPQGIPESTLRRYSKDAAHVDAAEDDEEEDEADSVFDEDLNTLQAYSLVSITVENDTCEMHALVQFCTRVWLSSFGNTEQWEKRFLVLMAQELPNGEYENWRKCQQLLPHVETLYDSEPISQEAQEAWAQVLTNAAWYLWRKGSYATAHAVAAKAVTTRERVLGLSKSETLTSVSILALVLQYQGKYQDAENLSRRVVEGIEKELGECHLDTLTSVDNLASVLQDQGKYEEAEKLYQRALKGREKELGVHHPHTLTSVSNLAMVLQDQGKYEDAEKLNWRALEGREKELGENHPDTLASVNNLALALQYQGKYEDAEKLSWRALKGHEKELGEHHLDTLSSVNNLAGLLRRQEKYEDAEKLSWRALKGREEELGEHHPHTLTSVYGLAYLLHTFASLRRSIGAIPASIRWVHSTAWLKAPNNY